MFLCKYEYLFIRSTKYSKSYMGQLHPTEEGSGPGLNPSKSYKLYSIQFNKLEYKNITKQILEGREKWKEEEQEFLLM